MKSEGLQVPPGCPIDLEPGKREESKAPTNGGHSSVWRRSSLEMPPSIPLSELRTWAQRMQALFKSGAETCSSIDKVLSTPSTRSGILTDDTNSDSYFDILEDVEEC